MTLPKRSLHPASRNDRGTLLRAFEFVASTLVQFIQVVWAVVGQSVPFEPRPKIFDRIQIGSVRRKKRNLDMTTQGVEIIANQSTAMCARTVPDHQPG